MRTWKYWAGGLLFVVALVLLVGSPERSGQAAAKKLKVLVVTGFDVGVHDWRATTAHTRTTLEATGRFDVKVSEDTGIFESSRLGQYDAIILNYGFWNEPAPSAEGRAGLLKFAESGKGVVALHFACSCFPEWTEYEDLLGRVWKKGVGGHGPRSEFTVKIVAPEHPITKGLSDFVIDDELYAKLSGDAELEVLATSDSDWSNRVEPMVFVKKYGKGRVVHNVLGHDVRARETPSFKKLLVRGVEWAATGAVAD